MNYEEAFEALKNREFNTAVPLLEKAASETGYSSDVINHAYTLALYQSGNMKRLAEVSFGIANALIEKEPASALDYFQRAIFAGLDKGRVRRIGEIVEQGAAPVNGMVVNPPIQRVAHVAGCMLPGHDATQYLKMLVSSLKKQGIHSTIFTTEANASWFFNSADVPQSQAMDVEAEVKIATVDGDFVERATRVAEAIRASAVSVAFFHASLAEQITARVAAMRPAALQVGVDHGTEMDADLFDGHIHLFREGLVRTRFATRPAAWIPPSSDIETRLLVREPLTRQAMGLESAATISATFGDLHKLAGSGYLRVLSEIMQRFPKHFHLFAGVGNVKATRSYLHGEGVLPRVRFLGDFGDVAPLLNVVDLYLASFPDSSVHSLLEAMGAGKPVVVMTAPPGGHGNSAAELVASPELTAPGEANYIQIADRLLRSSELRAKQGQAMLERFRAEFQPERLGERYKAFLASFQQP